MMERKGELRRKIIAILLLMLLSSAVTLVSSLVVLPVKAISGTRTIYIRTDGSIDPINASIQRNGDYYALTADISTWALINGSIIDGDGIVIERDNIILDGRGHKIVLLGAEIASNRGILLEDKTNVTLTNLCMENGQSIVISDCSQITLSNSTMTGLFGGVTLSNSTNNTITGNFIDPGYDGLLFFNSSNTLITENILRILRIQGGSNNSIYHNGFRDTPALGGPFVSVTNSENKWDNGYPSGGNFWIGYVDQNVTDLYHGVGQNETGSDGIGDTARYISKSNTDRYPLIKPYLASHYGLLNRTYVFYTPPLSVSVTSNSTVTRDNASANFVAKSLTFNVSGNAGAPVGTVGFALVNFSSYIQERFWSKGYVVLIDGKLASFINGSSGIREPMYYIFINYLHSNIAKNITILARDLVIIEPNASPGTMPKFSIVSNSTVSEFTFTSTRNELNFNVNGSDGTVGFADVTIAKNLLVNIADVKVYLDGVSLNYTITSTIDSWILHFSYPHSTHSIIVSLGITSIPEFPSSMILLVVMLTLTFIGAFKARYIRRKHD